MAGDRTTKRIAAVIVLLAAPASLVLAAVPGSRPGGAHGPLARAEQLASLRQDARAPRADLTIHGWRIAPPATIAREAPSARACDPRWTRDPGDLDFVPPDGAAGPDRSACAGRPMSVAYSLGVDTPYGEGTIDVARMRWDRPAFPVDAPGTRVEAARVAGRPAILVRALDPSGFGLAELLVIEVATFDPYATVLHLAGSNVGAPALVATAEAIEGVPRPPQLPALFPSPTPTPTAVPAEIRMFPPAGTSSGKLTGDWHCSAVSGDSCPASARRTCSPGDYGHSSCTALDWNDGTPNANERAWFRALAFRAAPTTLVRADVSGYTSTCQVVKVAIVDEATVVGALYFQHLRRARETFAIDFANDGAPNEIVVGRMVDERRLNPSCPWTGYHVHEDDGTARHWAAWNARRFRGKAGARFTVDAVRNWTRALRWESMG
jgi:hypothetical protein